MRLVEKFRRGMHITMGEVNVDMSHVGGQRRQPRIDVQAVPIPLQKPTARKSVPQAVNRGPFARPAGQVARPKDLPEGIIGGVVRESLHPATDEQRRVRQGRSDP